MWSEWLTVTRNRKHKGEFYSVIFLPCIVTFILIFSKWICRKERKNTLEKMWYEQHLCNPLTVVAARVRAKWTWLMKQLFLHQVVKTQQWQIYKEIILNLSHHTCGWMDLQEESWFLFTLFQGFWGRWKQIHPLLWARAFQKTTRICSHLSSTLDNDPEDVPSAQRSLRVQCPWRLLPPPIWD